MTAREISELLGGELVGDGDVVVTRLRSILSAGKGDVTFLARATYDGLPAAIERRFGGIVDTVTVDFAPGTSAATRRATVEAIRKIPSSFRGFAG